MGSYTYGDSAHLHAATSVGTGSNQYTASYDASGNMTCRAPTGSTTCNGTNTGQQLSWDNEGRLVAWQNAPSSPTSTDQYLYDGEGNRVAQQVTSGSTTTTTTVYIGALETVTTTGSTTTTTTYYYAAGQRIALAVNGTLSYLASDLLGSATVALNASGLPTASQLYAPYGTTRYANGSMPTDYGFTGQRPDSATGLDYYGARYYDPTIGRFVAADIVLQGGGHSICGLDRYGYVKDNPETLVDPSGNCPQRAPTGARARKFIVDLIALVGQLAVLGHDVGQYSGTNQNGGGSPEYTVAESTYNPTKNVASAGSPPCDDTPNKGTRTAYLNPETGELSGLKNRATRRGQQPAQVYGPEGTNGVQGAQVPGKNAGAPKRLLDGSYNRFQFAVYMKRMSYYDRQMEGFLADSGYTPPQPSVYPASPGTPSPPGWVPWAVAGCILLCPGIVGGLIALDIFAPEVGVPLDVALAGVLITAVSVSDPTRTNTHALVS